MLHKEVLVKDAKKPEYIDDMTSFNSLPTPYEECSFKEFYKQFVIFSPMYTEFRQPFDKDHRFIGNFRLYYYADEAFAVQWDYEDPNKSKVFRCGCKHEWQDIPTHIRCLHRSKCKKCGVVMEVDSSD